MKTIILHKYILKMISSDFLLEVITDQIEGLKAKPKGLLRQNLNDVQYLDGFARIVSGIRRCGKSTLLYQLLLERNLNALYINFDDPRLFDFELSDFQKLDKIIEATRQSVLMFDEIQLVKGWERYVRQKLDANYKIFVTGSNASLLSKELGSSLTGRHITTELFPFSFAEFCEFKSIEKNADSSKLYMKDGGFPEYVKYQRGVILTQLLDDILIRDIAVRYNIKDEKSLQRLASYLLSNIGNLTSANKLREPTTIKSTTTILEYLSHLENAYLFSLIPKFDFSLKKQNVNPKKIYAIDTGLVNAYVPKKRSDKGHQLENLVFSALRRVNKEIFYHAGAGECDFLVFHRGEITQAIQVCYELTTDNKKREFDGLMEAMDAYNLSEGYIISHNQEDEFQINGKSIKVIPAYKFI